MPTDEPKAYTPSKERCGFCTDGIFFSSRRDAEGLPPEVPCPYCDGTGEAQ